MKLYNICLGMNRLEDGGFEIVAYQLGESIFDQTKD